VYAYWINMHICRKLCHAWCATILLSTIYNIWIAHLQISRVLFKLDHLFCSFARDIVILWIRLRLDFTRHTYNKYFNSRSDYIQWSPPERDVVQNVLATTTDVWIGMHNTVTKSFKTWLSQHDEINFGDPDSELDVYQITVETSEKKVAAIGLAILNEWAKTLLYHSWKSDWCGVGLRVQQNLVSNQNKNIRAAYYFAWKCAPIYLITENCQQINYAVEGGVHGHPIVLNWSPQNSREYWNLRNSKDCFKKNIILLNYYYFL